MGQYLLARKGASAPTGTVGERTLYHLSLDLSLPQIVRSPGACAALVEAISHPLINVEDIAYRQAVARDFISHPGLLSSMKTLSRQLDDIRSSWNAFKRSKLGGAHAKRSAVRDARERCSFSASTLGRLLYVVRDMKDTLESYRPTSDALRSLLSELKQCTAGGSFEKLVTVCGDIERCAESGPANMRVTLDGTGKICAAELIDGGYVKITDPETRTRRRLFSKPVESYRCESVSPTETETGELMPTPFAELANVTDSIIKEIVDRYSDIGRELLFYEAAAEYAAFLTRKEVPFVFPDFGNVHSFTGLYDVALLTEHDAADIVPHTFTVPERTNGIIIYGENGSGKTSFLRSLTTSQLLAQAGLPIPASDAALRIYTSFSEQFAEGEKEFAAGNDAGRFEQEVREMSALVNGAASGALVILNETFQSTSYEEGADGLSHILRYLSRRGVFYILATHMTQLRPKMEGEALFLRMNDRFTPEADAAE